MRLVCFPFTSAADSGLGFSGRVDVPLVVDGELAAGGGVVLGVSCAVTGIASAIARKTSQHPYRVFFARIIGPIFDAAGNGVVRCGDETRKLDTDARDSDGHRGGIKLSRGKFNAPEREKSHCNRLCV